VKIGLTDGTLTEVEGNDLTEGLRIIIGEASRETVDGTSAERSPFTPQVGGAAPGQTGSGGPVVNGEVCEGAMHSWI